MPDTHSHRGPGPRDAALFAADQWPRLRAAVAELSWLLGRGYAEPSALKLVGDRHTLTERQRMAVRRCACGDESRFKRRACCVAFNELRDQRLLIDGFNVLTTVEAALGGAVVLLGRDGAYRDLAGVHGTYRRVEETRPAALLVGGWLAKLGINEATWYLDSPVSNSGRLARILRELASESGWPWHVELAASADPILAVSQEIVATADSAILDRVARWFPLARAVIDSSVPSARVVDLDSGIASA